MKKPPPYNYIGNGGWCSLLLENPIAGKHTRYLKGVEIMAMSQTVIMRNETGKTFSRVIKEKCLDCSGGVRSEVRDCWATNCPLFPYRFGKKPGTAIKELQKSYNVKVLQTEKEG